MLVIQFPLANLGRLLRKRVAPRRRSPFLRACLISVGLHLVTLALAAYLGSFRPWPDRSALPRMEVRLENRAKSASPQAQTPLEATTNDEGARANGAVPVGSIVVTPPEPLGDAPLLIDGTPGTAQLQLDIDANGKVTAVRIQHSTLEPNTEREMIERMQAIRFRPGLENGKPAVSRLVLEVRVERSLP